jgi:hypothetical protein
MQLPDLQTALAANPVITIFVVLIAALLVFFLIRTVFRTLGCLIHLLITAAVAVGIYLLIQNLLGR